ncbi:MAG: glutamate-1-semialdehyde 2,1-aminomutase [Nitrospirae bacterium]|nr:glutamate-1-semialdehyde 2,1-aminomutase [Nitrospirota bacterium]
MSQSEILFKRAKTLIPGGVNSPVRAFKAVGGSPLFIKKAKGAMITDVDNNAYIDFVLSWGPMILGHAHPLISQKIETALKSGTSFGASTPLEVKMAELAHEAFPSIEMVRMVSSGTEAAMSALRLARGYTGRDKILKFEGCYHGHSDSLLVKAGSGLATLGIPDSAGIPKDFAKHTLTVPYNDLEAVRRTAKTIGSRLAAIIVEPVAGNMGLVPPFRGFLEGLREICDLYDIVLIFDEVITGFRLSYGGAQQYYGVAPDLTCLGKIIGGGLPVGAYGGKRKIMSQISPSGPVYQAGTLSGNPLAMTAGITALKILKKKKPYQDLEEKTAILVEEIRQAGKKENIPLSINQIGSLFTPFFTSISVTDYPSAKTSDTRRYGKFFNLMLKEGVYLPPSQFETAFLSTEHGEKELEKTIQAARKAFKKL